MGNPMNALVTQEMRDDFVAKCRLGLQKYGGKPGKYVHKYPESDAIHGCCAVGGYLLNLIGLPDECLSYVESKDIPKEYVISGYVSGVITGFDNSDCKICVGCVDAENGYQDGQMLRKEFVK